jgi:hydrogenase maturation protein HypF
MGRLFDVAAALLGFTREMTFEGQAAIWLEYLAHGSRADDVYPFPVEADALDFRPLLREVIDDRKRGRPVQDIARIFHCSVARGVGQAALDECEIHCIQTVVLSGGVFQNRILLDDLHSRLTNAGVRVWTNSAVPPNDGGVSLGQAAIAALQENEHA